MKVGIFLFFSILVMVLAGIWLIFFRTEGVELVLVMISLAVSIFTMLLIFLYNQKHKRRSRE
ncbi:MAG: hypothetical protein FWJ59_03900 [Caldicoprobacter sp.]|uniref:hypothetical protein n=1 Tax=Caldicoprobacter sp. TaxID=2004500 RepID=UPI001E068744|nr:hypothetical protein [Clostridia bacterium]